MRLHTTLPDPEAVARLAATEIAQRLHSTVEERGVAHLALSGGTTPGRTYELLGHAVGDWSQVQIWFADERCVEPEDPESNYRLVRERLLEQAGVLGAVVHRMRGELGPERGAREYAQLLGAGVAALEREAGPVPALDVVLLGIGPDGHVASLFPRAASLSVPHGTWCVGVHESPKPPPRRISLTLEILRGARCCLLLATGESKAQALAAMLGAPSPASPASLLERERLLVMSDQAAAAAVG